MLLEAVGWNSCRCAGRKSIRFLNISAGLLAFLFQTLLVLIGLLLGHEQGLQSVASP